MFDHVVANRFVIEASFSYGIILRCKECKAGLRYLGLPTSVDWITYLIEEHVCDA